MFQIHLNVHFLSFPYTSLNYILAFYCILCSICLHKFSNAHWIFFFPSLNLEIVKIVKILEICTLNREYWHLWSGFIRNVIRLDVVSKVLWERSSLSLLWRKFFKAGHEVLEKARSFFVQFFFGENILTGIFLIVRWMDSYL